MTSPRRESGGRGDLDLAVREPMVAVAFGRSRWRLRNVGRGTARWGGIGILIGLIAMLAVSDRRWVLIAPFDWLSVSFGRGAAVVGYSFDRPILSPVAVLPDYSPEFPQSVVSLHDPWKPDWIWRIESAQVVMSWASAGSNPGASARVRIRAVPMIYLVLGAAVVNIGIMAATRRYPAGRCRRCGYDLAGLAAGAMCPECGGGARPTPRS